MRAAKIVYILISIVILLPWLVYNLKVYLNIRKEKSKPSIGRIVYTAIVTLLIVTAIFSHYRFTLGFQLPLAAERAGELFTRHVEGALDLPGYQSEMQKQGLSANGFAAASDEDLKAAGFQRKHYSLHISERSFPMEDGSTVLYLMHSDGQATLYSYVKLQQEGYRWQVAVHDSLPQQEFEKINDETKIKFYAARP
jgi:hypothetical protein